MSSGTTSNNYTYICSAFSFIYKLDNASLGTTTEVKLGQHVHGWEVPVQGWTETELDLLLSREARVWSISAV